jgi:hypothetical protein
MGLQPTRENQNRRRRPREGGDPLSVQWIPAFAGMTNMERSGFAQKMLKIVGTNLRIY